MSDMNDKARVAIRDIVAKRIKQRHAAEMRFRGFGIAMITTAILACGLLIAAIFAQAIPAMTENRLHLAISVIPEKADPVGKRNPLEIREQGNFFGMVQDSLVARFPTAEADGHMDDLFDVVTSLAAVPIGKKIAADPGLIGKSVDVALPINDDLDLFLKGAFGKTRETKGKGNLVITSTEEAGTEEAGTEEAGSFAFTGDAALFAQPIANLQSDLVAKAAALESGLRAKQKRLATTTSQVTALKGRLEAVEGSPAAPAAKALLDTAQSLQGSLTSDIAVEQSLIKQYRETAAIKNGVTILNDDKPTILIEINGGTYKLATIAAGRATGTLLVRPNATKSDAPWTVVQVATPQNGRAINDTTLAYGRLLSGEGKIKPALNTTVLKNADSNEPELAGILSALVGSILTLAITFGLAVPIGVATAVYLEEFAPKNWLSDLIEVNINNLAAVPSIVFGLLGFAVFLTFFNMPRSAPIVGGIVLALMSLPVIIIASRAALKAVPPSIREAALGVGASKTQAIFHHVLPLAMPGIMTGSILSMAHALGETAPLLMIGMVAFIADVPTSFSDSATVLPVELFMWASRPERAWEPRTALAILLLLFFMILMNAAAIYLRRKFERRW